MTMCNIDFKKCGKQNFFAKILMLSIGLYLLYLLLTCGPHDHRLFLLFVFPPAAFCLLSRRTASLYNGFIFTGILIIFLLEKRLSWGFQYETEFKFMFLFSFFAIVSICFGFEIANNRYRQDIEKKQLHFAQAQTKMSERKNNILSTIDVKNEFLSNMSHELRTPLNHIIGFTELVVDQKVGKLNQTQKEYLSDALKSSKYLFALINDILDLKRIETGQLELEITEIDIKTLLEKSLTMIRERALNHGIQVSISIDSVPITIRADQHKMEQVLYNLLSNAAKFTPDGGTVIISAQRTEMSFQQNCSNGGAEDLGTNPNFEHTKAPDKIQFRSCVEFVVADTGIGIKTADLERIFNRFEQADGSSRKKFQGTGLGLSLSKSYVELHGGRIWAESEGEGKGGRFKFVIPS